MFISCFKVELHGSSHTIFKAHVSTDLNQLVTGLESAIEICDPIRYDLSDPQKRRRCGVVTNYAESKSGINVRFAQSQFHQLTLEEKIKPRRFTVRKWVIIFPRILCGVGSGNDLKQLTLHHGANDLELLKL